MRYNTRPYEKEQGKAVHTYSVKYIKREGHAAEIVVSAKDHDEAKRVASDAGCEDIISVRRVSCAQRTGCSFGLFLIVLLALAALALAYFHL